MLQPINIGADKHSNKQIGISAGRIAQSTLFFLTALTASSGKVFAAQQSLRNPVSSQGPNERTSIRNIMEQSGNQTLGTHNTPVAWNRAVVIMNGDMPLETAEKVTARTADYYSKISRGRLAISNTFFEIEAPRSNVCSLNAYYRDFYKVAQEKNWDISSFNRFTFILSPTCGIGGIGVKDKSFVGASSEYRSFYVDVHESGHMLGGNHACKPDLECSADINDPLGFGKVTSYNAPHLIEFNFLDSSEILDLERSELGNHSIGNLDDFSRRNEQVLALRVRDSQDEIYYIAYRNTVEGEAYSETLEQANVVEIHNVRWTGVTLIQARLSEGETFDIESLQTTVKADAMYGDSALISFELMPTMSPTEAASSQPTVAGSIGIDTTSPTDSKPASNAWSPVYGASSSIGLSSAIGMTLGFVLMA